MPPHRHNFKRAPPSRILLHCERNDDVGGSSKLRALGATAVGRGAIQRRIIANLGSDNQSFERLRYRRLDVKSQRELAIGGRSATDRNPGRIAVLDLDEAQIAGERGNEEALVVAPNFGTALYREPVVELISKVLRNTVTIGVEAVVANIVQIVGERELVIHLPYCRDVIEVAESGIGIDARSYDRRHVLIFRTNMGSGQDGQRAAHQVQSDAAMERDGRVVVPTIDAIKMIAKRC